MSPVLCSSCAEILKRKYLLTLKEFILNKRSFSSAKYDIQLFPKIKEDLQAGEIKHRKHPGVRKLAPIQLPHFVRNAVYRLISNQHESAIVKEGHELVDQLMSRRLPLERHEMDEKIYHTASDIQRNEDDIPEMLKKVKILQLRKQLQMEIGRWKSIEYDRHTCLTYLAGRASPNHASVYRVFSEIKVRDPTFQPKTFFDFGSGIGSALWAAHSFWSDSIKEYFCVDSSSEMNELCQNILTEEISEEMFIKPVHYRQFLPASEIIKYDLVVSAFSLMDLPSAKERLQAIDTLWRKTKDLLVIIEFGNLAGFSTILDARDYILHIENGSVSDNAKGAHVLCPCPHDVTCPMLLHFKDPCGLTVLYETIFPRQKLQFKRDWISYVVLRKGRRPENDLAWPRLVKPVLKKSKHAYCNLCCNNGEIAKIIVTKSKHGRHEYRSVKSSSLGDLLPVDVNVLSKENDVNVEDMSFSESDDEQNKS